MAKRQEIRKPSNAQIEALAWLVESREGREWYDECRAVARPVTWAAMEKAGWVKRDEHWRIVATDDGRKVIAPTLRGRAEAREIIAEIKREAEAKNAALPASATTLSTPNKETEMVKGKQTGTCEICGRTDVAARVRGNGGLRLAQHRMVRSDPNSRYCSGFDLPVEEVSDSALRYDTERDLYVDATGHEPDWQRRIRLVEESSGSAFWGRD